MGHVAPDTNERLHLAEMAMFGRLYALQREILACSSAIDALRAAVEGIRELTDSRAVVGEIAGVGTIVSSPHDRSLQVSLRRQLADRADLFREMSPIDGTWLDGDQNPISAFLEGHTVSGWARVPVPFGDGTTGAFHLIAEQDAGLSHAHIELARIVAVLCGDVAHRLSEAESQVDLIEPDRSTGGTTLLTTTLADSLEFSSNPIMLLEPFGDPAGESFGFRVVATNVLTEQQFGRTRGQIVNSLLREVSPAFASDTMSTGLIHTFRTGEPFKFTHHMRQNGADDRWIEIHAVRVNSGLLVEAWDTTASARAERIAHERQEHLRVAVHAANMATWEWWPHEHRVVRGTELCKMYGVENHVDRLTEDADWTFQFVDAADHPLILEAERLVREHRQPFAVEYRVNRPDGSVRWLRDQGDWLREPDGSFQRIAGVTLDITESHLSRQRIHEADARYRRFVEQLPGVTYVVTGDPFAGNMRFEYVSPQAESLLGICADEIIEQGQLPEGTVHPDDLESVLHSFGRARETGEASVEFRVLNSSGEHRWLRDHHVFLGTDGSEPRFQGTVFDVTEEHRAKAEIEFQAALLDQADVSIVSTDPNGIVTQWNRGAERMYGYSRDEARGRLISDLVLPPNAEVPAARLIEMAIERQGSPVVVKRQTKHGEVISVQTVTTPIKDSQGKIEGIVGVAVDLSERLKLEQRLTELAYHDTVTGLPNRTSLMQRLESSLNGASGKTTAILFLDLDRFKIINDSLGQTAGDELLKAVAVRLRDALDQNQFLARFGGDEFVVLDFNESGVEHYVALANALLDSITAPFTLLGREIYIRGSIGIEAGNLGDQDGNEVLRRAHIAVHRAKALGGARAAVFNDEDNRHAMRVLTIESELRRGLERSEFELHYQPIVGLDANGITGFEALIRWKNPNRGMVSPAEFIPLAEQTGLIVQLGRWAAEEAIQRCAEWTLLRPDNPPHVAVNVSPVQFHDTQFSLHLAEAMERAGVIRNLIGVEVTEAAVGVDENAASSFLSAARLLGVRISLDDFGTGYSSLSRLHSMPLDVVKIDRSFISRLGDDPHADAIVRAVSTLAHDLGLSVTAEGIETDAQRVACRILGCDHAQGFLFSRPVPASAVPALLIA